MSLVRVTNVEKSFGDVSALKNLSLEINSGELFGFLGANGAGKTTTINILTGQLHPDSGSVEVMGINPVTDPVDVRSAIGILPERESPPSSLTPREYFQFVADIRNLDDTLVEENVTQWVSRLDLEEHLDTLHSDLSRGQQQKVMIIQAFLHEPEFVLIDEPLVNLDPIMQERVKDFLVQYQQQGNTIFLSTHDLSVAEDICSRIGILRNGELVTDRESQSLTDSESVLELFNPTDEV